jgi:homoserine kinase type II
LTRLVDWLNVPPGALVHPKDPREYVRKLQVLQTIGGGAELGLIR